MKRLIMILLCVTLMATPLLGCGDKGIDKNLEREAVTVDFALRDGTVVQNLKKMDGFSPTWDYHQNRSPGYLKPEAIDSLKGMEQLRLENFRFDLMIGNGGMGDNLGAFGGDGSSDNEWAITMQFIKALNEQKAIPNLVTIGVPEYAALEGTYGYTPDMEKYYEFCYNLASYLKRNEVYALLETWNEPDYNKDYWFDEMHEFVQTAVIAGTAFHDANPFATVLTPGLCWPINFIREKVDVGGEVKTNWQRLWELTKAGGQMPDGFSWHFYGWGEGTLNGGTDETKRWSYWTDIIRTAINSYADGSAEELNGKKYDFRKLQQHLTEFNPCHNDEWRTRRQVWAFFDGLKALNEATDITRASWSQYLGGAFSLMDASTYEVHPAYHVQWIYGRLPVDLVPVSIDNALVGAMAGADSERAGLVVYNRSGSSNQGLDITFNNLPAGVKSCDVYIINQDDYDNQLFDKTPVLDRKISKIKNGMKIKLDVPQTGAYYIEFNTQSGNCELDNYKDIGRIVKKEYYYPDRDDNLPYSDIYNANLNAYIGMANHDVGESGAAIILDELIQTKELTFNYECWGGTPVSDKATLGVRIDYHTGEGFAKSVFLSVNDFDGEFDVPFGTEKAPNETISMGSSLNGSYSFALKQNAPKDWDGMVEISYLIKNAGAGTTAKFSVA